MHIIENDWTTVYDYIRHFKAIFTNKDGNGVPLLVYSVILTKGIEVIKSEMDIEGSKLTTEHGYAGQELVNLMLTGKAHTNVHDGDKEMGEDFTLRGIPSLSDIGFLTLYEAYGYFEVGKFYKNA
jgi:hypothetical protein